MTRFGLGHIEATADTCGGKPRVTGTRIRVQDIVTWTEIGRSPDEIVDGHPQLSLADVYAALAYYHDHRQDIDRQIKEDDEFVAQCRAAYLARPTGKDADANSLSP